MDTSFGPIRQDEGFHGQKWDILGQIYVPLHVTETSMSLHATFPAGTFVPLHVHDTQDEFIYILEGEMEFTLGEHELKAGPGTQLTLPKGIAHALYNRSAKPAVTLVTASPTRMLYEYMQKINGMTDREEMARLAAAHEVPFI